MNINLNEMRKHIEIYFKENLPQYTVLEIKKNPATSMTAISLWYQQK